MHQHLDTVKSGIVRVSLSFMNTKEEIQFSSKQFKKLVRVIMIISVIGSGGKTNKNKTVKRSIFKRR